ncbi:MAG: hypothetical protein ABI354_00660 [Candidatus Saccharimonadales bacterium]
MESQPEVRGNRDKGIEQETIISLRAVTEITRQLTHCVVNGEAMTLEEFEEIHNGIVLGAN